MNITFNEKVVLVTGASTGIGRATAIQFAKSGASVVVNYNSSKDKAKQVVNYITEQGGKAIDVQADVSKADQVDKLVQKSLDAFGKIDILVNNAGSLIQRQAMEEMTEDLWDKVMNVNLKSAFLCSQAVIPVMKKNNWGRIINVSSIAARNGGGPGAGHYSTAKGGMLTFTKSLAKELAKTPITVNGIAPGVISTPFHDRFSTTETREKFKQTIPLGREGRSDEIAFPILFLASDYSSYILGETIEVNGGMLLD
jgi:3-oxoacyl-[acyl-carrier protein] reductase